MRLFGPRCQGILDTLGLLVLWYLGPILEDSMLVDLRGHIKAITVGELLVILEKLDRDVLVSPNTVGNLNLIKPNGDKGCQLLGYIDLFDDKVERFEPPIPVRLDRIN